MDAGKEYTRRIDSDPSICGGVPCVRGTRIPVSIVLSHLAAGDDQASLLNNFPQITKEDIQACLQYAAFLSTEKLTSA
jgi:uncharacterized protein (DUF433 family)